MAIRDFTPEEKKRLETYLWWRSGLQNADLLLWQSKTILGRAIQIFSGAECNHASFVLRLTGYGEELAERVYILEALAPGIVLMPLSTRLLQHKGKVWWMPLRDEWDKCRLPATTWAISKVGTNYDYRSLLKQIAVRVSADARLMFCSEYYFLSLRDGAAIPLHGPAPRPGDLPHYGLHTYRQLIHDSSSL